MLFALVTNAQEKQFQKACKKNTIEAYNKFIDKYPNSEFIQEATFKVAEISNTIDIWDNFLLKYPNGLFAEKAIDYFYKIVIKNNTVADYEKFIIRIPKSKYSEEIAYKKAILINTIDSYDSFLFKYPNGLFAEKAIDYYYKIVIKNNTVADYEKFLTRIPKSKYSEEIAYKKAILLNTIEVYQDFLNEFSGGNSTYFTAIKAKIDDMKWDDAKRSNSLDSYLAIYVTDSKYKSESLKKVKEIYAILLQDGLSSNNVICLKPVVFSEDALSTYSKNEQQELSSIIQYPIKNIKNSMSNKNCNLSVDIECDASQWTSRLEGGGTDFTIKYNIVDNKYGIVFSNTYKEDFIDGRLVDIKKKSGNIVTTYMTSVHDFEKTKKLLKDFIININPLIISKSTEFEIFTEKSKPTKR